MAHHRTTIIYAHQDILEPARCTRITNDTVLLHLAGGFSLDGTREQIAQTLRAGLDALEHPVGIPGVTYTDHGTEVGPDAA